MDFALTPAQRQKRDEFREFVQQYVEPVADQIDRSRRVPLTVVRHAAKRGYLAPTVPTEYGGSGYDVLTFIADTDQDFSVPTNIVKYLGGRVAGDVADKVLQIHGGGGLPRK